MRLHGLDRLDPLGLPAFLFVITLVVFFHELGHFLVARAFGVKVDVFSVGFGQEIVGWTDRHGTRWKISWLPIGGYVKFAGDADAASHARSRGRRAHDARRSAKACCCSSRCASAPWSRPPGRWPISCWPSCF